MNEASNFCNGACYSKQAVENSVANSLKYTPSQRNLETKSIAVDVRHYDGTWELDAHNIYGISEIQVTHQWF
jgi:hypothetical protein